MDDLGLLLEELMDVCQKWYVLGLKLKVSVQTLDGIRAQFADTRDQLLAMLKTWLITHGNHSWESIIDALRSRDVDEWMLSQDLLRKYYLLKETEVYESKR